MEASLLGRFHPLISSRLACITHPIGAVVIGLFGGGAAAAFALLHGAGNGILTIARETTVGDLRAGELRLPTGADQGAVQALAPLAAGTYRTRRGVGFGSLSLSALVAYCCFHAGSPSTAVAAVAE